ncbi:MAG: SMEK domain-containing protein [Verrucomicrobia bacterium]|nr:SMEK domain-containing protein [Verrucomicrobiota bacterium]
MAEKELIRFIHINPIMTTSKALDDISSTLGRLQHQISLENAAGYFSKNKILENILLPVLAKTYDLPHLRNANAKGANEPYVDLVDDLKKFAFQITTERHASKITDTLTGFVASKTFQKYSKLQFFIFAPKPVAFSAVSRKKWTRICRGKFKFKQADDIVEFTDLYRDISNLSGPKIREIRDLLAQSVVGEEWIDVRTLLVGQAITQVNREKETGKYIPDIFVETTSTKALSRVFWHPHLFFGEILDSVTRCRLPIWNKFLAKCGLPLLPVINAEKFRSTARPEELASAAQQIEQELLQLAAAAKLFDGLNHGDLPPCPIAPGKRDFHDQNAWRVRDTARVVQEWTEDQIQKLHAVQRRVFILTGKAGQGKTNLVCDFVERFGVPHEVPCAYFTGLQLGRISGDLGEHIQRTLLQGKTPTFQAAARVLSNYAAEKQQPFVFVFEGLNEHSRISQFAGELEELVSAALKFPNVRFYFTCRSEYFIQRFGNLLKSTFKNDILLVEPRQQYLGDFARDQLLDGYFRYFEVDPNRVDEQAQRFLQDDTLLLRFFCVAYGKRGRPANYQMPDIPHIYRAQIFDLYLNKKLDDAADTKNRTVQQLSPVGSKKELLAVIRWVTSYMVIKRQFSDVPFSEVPTAMHSDLWFLLGEEILLRRDPAPSGNISLAAPADVLNFVYDEFRDFLIAKYLVENFDPMTPSGFATFVAASEEGTTQISEGIKRFLFYTSRLPDKLEFWKYYSQQPAYDEVFVPEIFFVAEEHHNTDDAVRVRTVLEKANHNSTRVAEFLLWRGPRERFPFLNLDLLIDTLADGDDDLHAALIRNNFLSYYQFQERSQPAQEWVKTFEKYLIPCFNSTRHEPYVQLMTILFPLERESDLESPVVRLFRRIAANFPALAHKVLSRALEFKFTTHRPYVWRLLAEQNLEAGMIANLRTVAEGELASASAETATEIRRFLLKSAASRP